MIHCVITTDGTVVISEEHNTENYFRKHNKAEIVEDITIKSYRHDIIVDVLKIIGYVHQHNSNYFAEIFHGCMNSHVSFIISTVDKMSYEDNAVLESMVTIYKRCSTIIEFTSDTKSDFLHIHDDFVRQKQSMGNKIVSYFQQKYDSKRMKKNA